MLLGVIEEIKSFPFRRLIRTRMAKATLASHAPKAKMNMGMVKNMVEVDDRVNESISVRDKIDASSERRHISSLFRIMIIEEIVTKEIIKVSSWGWIIIVLR